LLISFLIFFCVFFFLLYIFMHYYANHYLLKPDRIDFFDYALVLGAGLEKDGKPSDILLDRILTAVNLYKKRKVGLLVMSGSVKAGYDEVQAMKATAIKMGVPPCAIRLDRRGISTFHSCINLVKVFAPQTVLIVSQKFHLPRAIFLQRLLGVKAFGIPADNIRFSFLKIILWSMREFFSIPYNAFKILLFFMNA